MEELDYKEVARMLSNPEGEFGIKVAEKMNQTNYRIIKWALEALQIEEGDQVMEIGFGNGAHIKDILTQGKNIKYTGVDISETMLNEASRTYKTEIATGAVRLRLASSAKLPFAENSFNKIFTVNTLYFWEKPEEHLQQIYKVLKPGGVFCLAFKSKSFMKALPFVQYGFNMYDQKEAKALFSTTAFTSIKAVYKKEDPQEFNGKMLIPDAILISAFK